MPSSMYYGPTLDRPRRGRTMPRIRWTREIPHHVAIRWTREIPHHVAIRWTR